jgi:hypothetical protein
MKSLGRLHHIAGVAVARAGPIMKVSRSFPPECAHRRTKPFTPFSMVRVDHVTREARMTIQSRPSPVGGGA